MAKMSLCWAECGPYPFLYGYRCLDSASPQRSAKEEQPKGCTMIGFHALSFGSILIFMVAIVNWLRTALTVSRLIYVF